MANVLWQAISVVGVLILCGAVFIWNTTNIDLQALQSLQFKYAAHADLQVLDDKLVRLESAKGAVQAELDHLRKTNQGLKASNDALQQRLADLESRLGFAAPEPASIESSPVESSLAEPSSAEPSPAEPSSAEPSPAEPSSTEPSATEPRSAEPSSAGKADETKQSAALPTAAPSRKPRKPKPKFRGGSDLGRWGLQKWFDKELQRTKPEWTERQIERHAPALKMLWAPVEQNGTIEWMLADGCGPTKLSTCTGICATKGLRCEKKELDAVDTKRKVGAAAKAAGGACGRSSEHANVGTWDGPWINGDTCGYASGRSYGNCNKTIGCGLKRICACTGFTAEKARSLPSAKRQRMMRWHRQWDHKCGEETWRQTPGEPKIPRHFHFTLIEERAFWINTSFPFELISQSHSSYRKLTQEEQLLIENMRHALIINNATSVHFMDNMACASATAQISQELLRTFLAESDLRYKSDICRVAALYLEGGYYFDDDMLSYTPVIPLIHQNTDIATAKSISQELYFQSFMAAAPCHPLLRRNADLLVEAKKPNFPKRLDGLLGPRTLKVAFDELKPKYAQLFQESGYDPRSRSYERIPARNGHQCGLVVYDPVSKKTPFCSRF